MIKAPLPQDFEHVETWIFDLDNTLYPADCNLFAEIDTRMGEFISRRFGVSREEAQRLRKTYYYQYGTTLAGLMRLHDVCPNSFLDYVHDIDLSVVAPAPDLHAALEALPGRKFIFTNGSRTHAEKVIARLGIEGHFEDVFDIHALEYIHPKPALEAYERFVEAHGVVPHSAAMFDDLPHNLKTAHDLGMTTVLVASGQTDHPEHRAIDGWSKLPAHIHHCTDALAPFLSLISTQLVRDTGPLGLASPPPLRDREGGLTERLAGSAPPSTPPSVESAPPQGGSREQVGTPVPTLQELKAAS